MNCRFRKICLVALLDCVFLLTSAYGKSPLRLYSPDKKILYEFEIRNGQPGYRVLYQQKLLIDFSVINVVFNGDSLTQGVRLEKWTHMDSVEQYTLMTGRSSQVKDPFSQLILYLTELKRPLRKVEIQIRAFDDGIAFRYVFPGVANDSLMIMREHSSFEISGNPFVHALVLPDYHTSHEGNYLHRNYRDLPEDSLIDMPMLMELPDNIYMAITEAALLDYAGMYLVKTKSGLSSNLSPLPGNEGYAVKAVLPHESPWRVILISKGPGRLLESNLITDLAPPCRLNDLSWLKPGKTTFPWWNGNVTPDTLNAPGNNFVTQQYYIDFCARSKIEYHSVVEYGLHQWYQDDGVSFMPGPNSNVLKAVPGLDMQEVCNYAHSKGVGVRVWYIGKHCTPNWIVLSLCLNDGDSPD
jgi:alpha-glucosidase